MKQNIVHIVGTGTIGEPLIGLFTDFRDRMGIDEVTFHKRTPLASDRSKVNHLMARGARLATDEDQRDAFEKMGHAVSYEAEEAIGRATVVVALRRRGQSCAVFAEKELYLDRRGIRRRPGHGTTPARSPARDSRWPPASPACSCSPGRSTRRSHPWG